MYNATKATISALVLVLAACADGRLPSTDEGVVKPTLGKSPSAASEGDCLAHCGGGRDSDDGEPRRLAPGALSTAGAPARGPDTAPVTLVVFSDFECPFCKRLDVTLDELKESYGERLRIVWKNDPLPFHERGTDLARFAEAAHRLGKFWEFRASIRRHGFDDAGLEKAARDCGVLPAKLRALAESDDVARAVQADIAEAVKLGVRGVPTMFVNGRHVTGALPREQLAAIVSEEEQTRAR